VSSQDCGLPGASDGAYSLTDFVAAPPVEAGVASMLVAYAVMYTGLLAVLRTRTIFDTDGRLLLPAAACALVVACSWLALRLPANTLRLLLALWLGLGTASRSPMRLRKDGADCTGPRSAIPCAVG
jgi:uncharacterized membrane protein YfcA